jgi:ribonuclease Z
MKNPVQTKSLGASRRDLLKFSGFALGGLAFGGAHPSFSQASCYPTQLNTSAYSYLNDLPRMDPFTPLEPNEMRISFMGSMIPPSRRVQAEMSIFVEVGWTPDPSDKVYQGRAVDQFVFDCGSGCCANYNAMKVGYHKMDKVFLNHLHADHMSDLSHIYCFGPSGDRKSPLYVWGPSASGVKNPLPPYQYYDDGTNAYCRNLREAMRWHTESFSFQGTAYQSYEPPTRESWGLPCDPAPVGDDAPNDAYALVPIELDWTKYGAEENDNIAYHNTKTGVKITHFPVIHCRNGSIGYKLEWDSPYGPLSMIYTSDTKPERHSISQAINGGKGVDAFIHEMIVDPEIWAIKSMGVPAPFPPGVNPEFDQYVKGLKYVQDSSHTPQGAFGYLLSQIQPRPRMTVATHFPVADDTVACALNSVRQYVPDITWNKEYDPVHKNLVWSFDLMVIRLFAGEDRILQQLSNATDFGFSPPVQLPADALPPKYHDENGDWDPYAQIDRHMEIPPEEYELPSNVQESEKY